MIENLPGPDNSAAVSTGIRYLDELLGGLFIGDSVYGMMMPEALPAHSVSIFCSLPRV
jgi:hypothetical protein